MEKVSEEVDLDEWEILPDDLFFNIHNRHGHGGKGLFLKEPTFNPKGVFDMNYFTCPSPEKSGVSRRSNQLIPVPIQLEPPARKAMDYDFVKDIIEVPIVEFSILKPVASQKIKAPDLETVALDQETVSQVFFKKMKENEFVDMKMDSPKSGNRGIKPQIEVGLIQFEEKEKSYKDDSAITSKVVIEEDLVSKNPYLDSNFKEEENWKGVNGGGGGGFNIWRWSMTGIGALCSVTMAAATICVFIMGNQRQNHHYQNQKLQFQLHSDEKKFKQMVFHTSRSNQGISAVRGVPLTTTRAHITFGGYYNGF